MKRVLCCVCLLLLSLALPLSAQTFKLQVFTAQLIDTTLGTTTLAQLPVPPCGSDCGTPTFTYNKVQENSLLKITYTDTLGAIGGVSSTCQYQLRIDGQPSDSSLTASAPFLTASNIVNSTFTSTGVFEGLGKGSHVLSIWHRQVGASNCIRNSGGFTTTILVEELRPVEK